MRDDILRRPVENHNNALLSTGFTLRPVQGCTAPAGIACFGVAARRLAERYGIDIGLAFVVEVVELDAVQIRVAEALGMTRQTIHNYREIHKQFGVEGLIHGDTVVESKSEQALRKRHADQRPEGNKAQQVAAIRRRERRKRASESETEAVNFAAGDLEVL